MELSRVARFAFPDFKDSPSCFFQCGAVALIAEGITAALFGPEFFVGCGNRFAQLAAVHVPEAAVDKDDRAEPGEHEVGFAGEMFAVEPIAESGGMQQSTNEHFGFRVAPSNAGHVVASLLGGMNVCHA